MNDRPKRNSAIDTSTLPDGHAVLVSKDTEWAFTLTPLAALVWEFCDGSNTVDDIVTCIQSIPEFSQSLKKKEITDLLDELDESGFLDENPASTLPTGCN